MLSSMARATDKHDHQLIVTPPVTAMAGSKVIISAALLLLLYVGIAHQDASVYEGIALGILVGGGYLASMHTYRIKLDDEAVELRSVYGRALVRLSDIERVRVSHLVSSAPFALTFVRRHGPAITWKIALFGRNVEPLLAKLHERFDLTDDGRVGYRFL
jgi:hypothetical protein